MRRSLVKNLCIILLLLFHVTASAVVLDPIHDPGNGYTCLNCHMAHVTLGTTGYNNICLDCHKPGVPKGGTKSFVAIDAADPLNIYTSALPGNRFQISHRWDGTDTVPAAGAQPPLLEAMTRLDLRGRTNGLLACVSCHSPHSNSSQPFLRMVNDSDQMCLDCHRSRNKSSHTAGTHPVNVKYSSTKTKYTPPINANPANPTSAMKLKTGVVLCTTCHSVHYADSNSATYDNHSSYNSLTPSDGYLLRTDLHGANGNSLNICTNCHAGKKNHTYSNQNIQCADCHAAHVDFDPQDPGAALGNNSFLVRRYINVSTAIGSVRKKRVFFLQTSASARNYKTVDNTGICQACHAVPTGSFYPTAHGRPTATASDCNVCHYHNNQAGAFSASGSCNACHGYLPTTGSHPQHAGTLAMTCSSCHGSVSSNAHIDGNVKWDLTGIGTTAQYKTPGGAYATVGSTGNPAPSAVYGNCRNIYCHGTAASPQWGLTVGVPLPCNTCHSANANSGYWNTNSAHGIHWEGNTLPTSYNALPGNSLGDASTYRFACSSCHYPGSTYAAHANGPANANGVAQVFFGYTTSTIKGAYVYGTTQGTTDNGFNWTNGTGCSSTYCHSNGNGDAGATAIDWATTSSTVNLDVRCNSCHKYTDASGSPMDTGSHGIHVSGNGFSCSMCHYSTTDNGSTITDKRKHVNKTKDVSWDPDIGGATPYSSPNCDDIYCHSKGTTFSAPYTTPNSSPVAWGGAINGCDGCHDGNGPNYANGDPKANSHSSHVNIYGCGECHNGGSHVDKVYDLAPGSYPFSVVGGTGTDTSPAQCINSYCHSKGTGPVSSPTYTSPNSPPVWGGAIDGCNGCHDGTATGPSYANGAPKANCHHTHVVVFGYSCDICHNSTTINGTTINNTLIHINNAYDILAGGAFTFDPTPGDPSTPTTCANISCHHHNIVASWDGSLCYGCHSPPYPW